MAQARIPNSCWFRLHGKKQQTFVAQRQQGREDEDVFDLIKADGQLRGSIRLNLYSDMVKTKDSIIAQVTVGTKGQMGECWWPRRRSLSELGEPVEGVSVRRATDALSKKPVVEVVLYYGDRGQRTAHYHKLPEQQAKQLLLQLQELLA